MQTSPGENVLLTIIALVALVVVFKIAITPDLTNANWRGKVARCKADHRSLATALEAYYVDHNRYPDWTSLTGSREWTGKDGLGHINAFAGRESGAASIHSFRVRTASIRDPVEGHLNLFHTLTTPIAYISSIVPDPFATTNGASYGYYSVRNGYIIYSFGPDHDEAANEFGLIGDIDHALEDGSLCDVVTGALEKLYNPNTSQPSITLVCGPMPTWAEARGTGAFTFDPTNGSSSEGDVWRVKN